MILSIMYPVLNTSLTRIIMEFLNDIHAIMVLDK